MFFSLPIDWTSTFTVGQPRSAVIVGPRLTAGSELDIFKKICYNLKKRFAKASNYWKFIKKYVII